MKTQILILVFAVLSTWVFGQQNRVILSGGYAFSNIEDVEDNGTGWRINGAYEFNLQEGNWAHGISVGYVNISGDANGGLGNTTYEIGTWPIYYTPKFLFGNEKIKGFIKGALGAQFSNLKRTGALGELSDNDFGFAGGGGVGASYFFNEKIFLNAEYELLWMSNTYYVEGLLNTASLGVGFRF
jgi:hypothetical protein